MKGNTPLTRVSPRFIFKHNLAYADLMAGLRSWEQTDHAKLSLQLGRKIQALLNRYGNSKFRKSNE